MKVQYVNFPSQYFEHKEEILSRLDSVLESGQFILGPEVDLFEKNFSRLVGIKHAIGVANGSDSLTMIMRAMGIGPGDEVITAPNSWISSVSSIIWSGATPVLVDVKDDQTIDPDQIEKAITSRTKAIMPVHLTGKIADMDSILLIAKRHNLKVIEDAAQAVGASYKGKAAGSIGDAASFSLHPLKNLNACGDAGIITTDNDNLASEIRLLRNHGIVTRDNIVQWGYNSRLDSLQAAILNVRIKYLDEVTKARRNNADIYRANLKDVVNCPKDAEECFDAYHTFVIQVDQRDELKNYLEKNGVGSAIHYPVPIHLYEAGRELGYKVGSFPVTEKQAKRILSLPIHQNVLEEDLKYTIDLIKKFYAK